MIQTLGLVLAGGRGVRLGLDRPKALASIGATTLLDRALACLGSCCDEVLVVAPRERELPIPPDLRVDDAPGAKGPLAGLVGGLMARPCERAVVLGVDFPLMRPQALRAMISRLEAHAAVVPVPDGVPQPLAAIYGGGASTALAARLAAGERSVTAAALALEPRLLDNNQLSLLEGGLENFFNVNRPEDLAEAERRLGGSPRHSAEAGERGTMPPPTARGSRGPR